MKKQNAGGGAMKTIPLSLTVLVALLLALLAFPALASTQSMPAADTYDLTWFTHDSGAEPVTSADGVYSLSSTAGQPDAGLLSSGGYTLSGGFWYGVKPVYRVALPVVEK